MPEEMRRFGRLAVKITRPDKVLFPEDGITKRELIDYYERIAPHMLPHLHGRPLAFERFPDGIGASGFFQQSAGRYVPDWVKRVTVKKAGGQVTHIVCDNTATLVYLANLAAVTPHMWLSRSDKLDCPDQMVFDLDPSGADFETVTWAARTLKQILDEMGLPAFLKSTGSRGLHVAVPLKRREQFDAVRAFARRVAERLVAREPGRWTLEQRKDKRHNRVFVDINRNAYGQTIAPVFAVRARRGAPISAPLEWEELEDRGLRPDRYTIRNIFEKLARRGDPWKDFAQRAVYLDRMGTESHAA